MLVRKPTPTPEVIADYSCTQGASPAWHEAEKRLYWVDAPRGRLFRYTPAARTHEQVYTAGAALGGLAVQADASVLLFLEAGTVKIWRESAVITVHEHPPGEGIGGCTCAAADPAGRVLHGLSLARSPQGRLCRMDVDGTVSVLAEGPSHAEGIGFTPDGRGMYCAGWPRRAIALFDYDAATGTAANPRTFVTFPESLGVPRGIAVDAKGFVWSAACGGSCAVRFSPEGREEQRAYFPAVLVTGLALGGEDGRDLYVTTAGGDERASCGPGAGALYRLRPGVRGRPPHLARVGIPRA
jgi:D-xylonolactonase